MKKFVVTALVALLSSVFSLAQVAINTDGTAPDNSAMLDVESTSKGMLPPRMTQAQIGAISGPANGLIVFCTTDNKLYIFIASVNQWKEVAYGTGTILPPFACGSAITINHAAGTVAPVTKTVMYGTVTGIAGEPTKCWITSNLGADHQATTVDDASEASAGWYWQFNRQQGYKHDGSTRTPNATWITSINENLDWQAAADPCALELGNGWRIPTYAEWINVDASGNWNEWNGPWNSGLKLHAAGALYFSSGALSNRGSIGYCWSSLQNGASYGMLLFFNTGNSSLTFTDKANGLSLRCIR